MFHPVKRILSMDRPSVEVIVPCYNYGRFLTDCIFSVIGQEGVDVSVHIVDDASTDDSYTIALSLAHRYPNVRTSRNITNLGHIETYNRGLQDVSAKYLVLLSADDLLAPGSLGRATALMEAYPNVGLVYGHPAPFEIKPEPSAAPLFNWSIWSGRSWVRAQFRRGLSIIYSPEVVVRTNIQQRVGLYRADLPHTADLEMWLRISRVADIGRVNGPDQAYRRIHGSSMMNTEFRGVLTDLRERQRAYEAYLVTPGLAPGDRTQLDQVMRKRLAVEALGWAIDHAANEYEVKDAIAYACSVNPRLKSLPIWQELQTTCVQGSKIRTRHWNRFRRNMGDRLRWRRWRTLGI